MAGPGRLNGISTRIDATEIASAAAHAGRIAKLISLRVSAILLALSATIAAARALGAEAFGAYVLAGAWAAALSTFGMAGLNASATRFVATYSADSRWPELSGFLRYSTRRIFAASCVLTLGVLATCLVAPLSDNGLFRVTLAVFALTIVPNACLQYLSPVLVAAGKPNESMIASLVPHGFVLGGAFVTGAVLRQSSPVTVALFYGLGLLFAVAYSLRCLSLTFPREIVDSEPVYNSDTWRKSASLNFVGNISASSYSHGMTIVTGGLCGIEAAGLYSIAMRIANQCAIISQCITSLVVPKLGSLYTKKQTHELHKTVSVCLTFSSIATAAAALAVFGFSDILFACFGPSYATQASTGLLILLLVSITALSAFGLCGYLLSISGREYHGIAASVAQLAIGIPLAVLLSPQFSIHGVAIAHVAAIAAWSGVAGWACKTHIGFVPVAFNFCR